MSVTRRHIRERHQQRRLCEQMARCHVVNACCAVQARGVPVAHVTRCLSLSERTARRWRHNRPAWPPEATAEVVQATYARLLAELGPPLVMKTDNGGPFRAEGTKRLLDDYGIIPLYSPKRRPAYNGGVERANGLMAGYQEAVAEFHGRRAGPTYEDAETARRWANELTRPKGWQNPTAGELWSERQPISPAERSTFQATVEEHRVEVRAEWHFAADQPLAHDPAAAIDRHAVRDALVEHGLLAIHPRRRKRVFQDQSLAPALTTAAPGAGILKLAMQATPSTVGGAKGPKADVPPWAHSTHEEAHYSTNNPSASGQN